MSANEISKCIDCETEYPVAMMASIVSGMRTMSAKTDFQFVSVGTCIECKEGLPAGTLMKMIWDICTLSYVPPVLGYAAIGDDRMRDEVYPDEL